MSGAGARLPVVPTVTVLGMVKIRLVAAKKGHQLLKKKARGAAQQRSGNPKPRSTGGPRSPLPPRAHARTHTG
jgi:hypothetical protein